MSGIQSIFFLRPRRETGRSGRATPEGSSTPGGDGTPSAESPESGGLVGTPGTADSNPNKCTVPASGNPSKLLRNPSEIRAAGKGPKEGLVNQHVDRSTGVNGLTVGGRTERIRRMVQCGRVERCASSRASFAGSDHHSVFATSGNLLKAKEPHKLVAELFSASRMELEQLWNPFGTGWAAKKRLEKQLRRLAGELEEEAWRREEAEREIERLLGGAFEREVEGGVDVDLVATGLEEGDPSDGPVPEVYELSNQEECSGSGSWEKRTETTSAEEPLAKDLGLPSPSRVEKEVDAGKEMDQLEDRRSDLNGGVEEKFNASSESGVLAEENAESHDGGSEELQQEVSAIDKEVVRLQLAVPEGPKQQQELEQAVSPRSKAGKEKRRQDRRKGAVVYPAEKLPAQESDFPTDSDILSPVMHEDVAEKLQRMIEHVEENDRQLATEIARRKEAEKKAKEVREAVRVKEGRLAEAAAKLERAEKQLAEAAERDRQLAAITYQLEEKENRLQEAFARMGELELAAEALERERENQTEKSAREALPGREVEGEAAVEKSENRLQEVSAQLAELQLAAVASERRLQETLASISDLAAEISKKDTALQDANTRVGELEWGAKESEKLLREANSRNGELEAEKTVDEKLLQEANSRIGELERAVQQKEQRCQELELEGKEKEWKVKEAQAQLQELERGAEEEIESKAAAATTLIENSRLGKAMLEREIEEERVQRRHETHARERADARAAAAEESLEETKRELTEMRGKMAAWLERSEAQASELRAAEKTVAETLAESKNVPAKKAGKKGRKASGGNLKSPPKSLSVEIPDGATSPGARSGRRARRPFESPAQSPREASAMPSPWGLPETRGSPGASVTTPTWSPRPALDVHALRARTPRAAAADARAPRTLSEPKIPANIEEARTPRALSDGHNHTPQGAVSNGDSDAASTLAAVVSETLPAAADTAEGSGVSDEDSAWSPGRKNGRHRRHWGEEPKPDPAAAVAADDLPI